MKIINSLFAVLILFLACNSKTETSAQKATFGIHEIAKTNELPSTVMDEIKNSNVQLENKTDSYIIGYVANEDNPVFKMAIPGQKLSIVSTIHKIDKDYFAIAAINTIPSIGNEDIKNARARGSDIEIYFTLDGAKKWADFTKANIGKPVAFVINNRIYSMPVINAEIKIGIAKLNGLSDETTARRITKEISNE